MRFTDGAVGRIADLPRSSTAHRELGARGLHTSWRIGSTGVFTTISSRGHTIDDKYVDRMLADIVGNNDLSRYIL